VVVQLSAGKSKIEDRESGPLPPLEAEAKVTQFQAVTILSDFIMRKIAAI
jgi:hypothetical protein